MKPIFIINPCAGKKRNTERLKRAILHSAELIGADAEFYITKAAGDGGRFVSDYCGDN